MRPRGAELVLTERGVLANHDRGQRWRIGCDAASGTGEIRIAVH